MPPLTTMVPRSLRDTIYEIQRDSAMNPGIEAMLERSSEFRSRDAALLAGIAMVPQARKHLDQKLDAMWAATLLPGPSIEAGVPEVIIGAGLHAAIYCSVRVAKGFPKPLVLEVAERAGGAFAMSGGPAFFLNSRNRPGGLTAPGEGGALNYLPGAPIQPSDLSSDEYQRNSDLAYIVRSTLAMNANVRTGVKEIAVMKGKNGFNYVIKADGQYFFTNRVIIATGLGVPMYSEWKTAARILSYHEFMKRMDDPFPLRGAKRIAVLGAGDSGKTVIEALTGQGPAQHWSVASLDTPERIDWYSTKLTQTPTRASWETCNRSRYKGIGRTLPIEAGTPSRVKPIGKRSSYLFDGFESAFVDDVPYDIVIDCRGFKKTDIPGVALYDKFNIGSRQVAFRCYDGYVKEIYKVGPAALIAFSAAENERNGKIPENATALFRYAERTASFAAAMP